MGTWIAANRFTTRTLTSTVEACAVAYKCASCGEPQVSRTNWKRKQGHTSRSLLSESEGRMPKGGVSLLSSN